MSGRRPPGPRLVMVLGHASGGIGAHAASLSRGLLAGGWRARVVCPPETAARFDFGVGADSWWPAGSPSARFAALRALRAAASRAGVVHAHGHQAGLVSLAATLGTGVPVIVSWHNAVLGTGLTRRVRALGEWWQARRAALVTGASQDLVARALSLGAASAELAPVAAPEAGSWSGDGNEARVELLAAGAVGEEDVDRPWVLTVSRIAPQKNLDVLVRAALAARGAGAIWWVIGSGDGDLEARLLDLARSGRGEPAVRFIGARSDVPRWMAAADVMALPSAWEARALVVQEAMAAGLPVVASAVGGLPELIGSAGVLVPPGDAGALADAVGGLLADPARRSELSALGRQRFAELPDEAEVVAAWELRYRGVLGDGPHH